MIAVPAVSSFPTGTDDSGTGSVTSTYYIAETEVTYELWSAVYTWATSDDRGTAKYTFANAGQAGSSSSGSAQQPVTTVSWHDTMVWCNALTEYYNAKGKADYACVYCTDTPILLRSGQLPQLELVLILLIPVRDPRIILVLTQPLRLPLTDEQ